VPRDSFCPRWLHRPPEAGPPKITPCYTSDMEPDKEPSSVEEALDVYWVDRSIAGHVPNYAGFQEWITRRFEALRSGVPLPLHAESVSYTQLPRELLDAAKAGGVQIAPEGATPHPSQFAKWNGKQSKIKRLNKSKLLLSYFMNTSPRWREVLLSLLHRRSRNIGPLFSTLWLMGPARGFQTGWASPRGSARSWRGRVSGSDSVFSFQPFRGGHQARARGAEGCH
jgi:hypothetical protein